MSNYLSEHDLENLFQTHLPPVEMPPEFVAHLEERVLAEVALSIRKSDNRIAITQLPEKRPQTVSQASHRSLGKEPLRAGHPVRFKALTAWSKHFNWTGRFERASSLALAGASIVVLLLFVLLLPRLVPAESGPGNQPIAPQLEVLPPIQPATSSNAQSAAVLVRDGAATLHHAGVTEMITAGSNARLDPGDTLQIVTGQTDIIYFQGQRTELEAGAQLRLVELNQNDDATQVVVLIESGRTRHQVETTLTADDHFEVRTSAARALVLGTDFVVDARSIDETYIATFSGLVFVETADHRVQVAAGQETVAHIGVKMVVQAQPALTTAVAQANMAEITPTSANNGDAQPGATPTVNAGDETRNDALDDTPAASPSPSPTPAPTRTITTPTTVAAIDNAANGNRPAAIPTATDPATAMPTATKRPVVVDEQAATATRTATPSPTPSPTPSSTATPVASTVTHTPAITATPTNRPTNTPANTPTSAVALPTATPSPTPSPTLSPTTGPDNRAPTAVDDSASTGEESSLVVAVLDNDRDADGDLLVITGLTEPQHGRVTNNGNGTITYTPVTNYAGSDQFTYRISDGRSGASATVTVDVTPINDKPTLGAVADQTVAEDRILVVDFVVGDVETGPGELVYTATAADPSLVEADGLTFGGDSDDVNRTLAIQPQPNQSGATAITLTVGDGEESVQRQFTLIIVPVNDAPVIGDLPDQIIEEEAQASFAVTITDVDNAGPSLQVRAISSDQSLIRDDNILVEGLDANRKIVLHPETDRSGSATITVAVSDGQYETTASFDLLINPVNDAPVIGAIDDQVTDEGNSLTLDIDVSDIDTNVNSLNLHVISSNSTLVNDDAMAIEGFGPTRTLTITPVAGQAGTATITIVASDGVNQAERAFLLTVEAVNEPPTANNDEYRGANGVITAQVLENDFDDHPDQLRIVEVGKAENGEATTDGLTVTYTPAPEFQGTEIITYTISDGEYKAPAQITFVIED